MPFLQLDEYFTHPDEMRGSSLQKQNTLMHQQLKSFEKALQQAEDYHNQDNLYKLIAPIIPAGVHIISFDGLQRIVGQSKVSKAGRKIPSQTSLYFRAFLDDLLQYLDHLHQMKDNFDERIYSVLFEYYYEIVFEDVKSSNQKKQTVAKKHLMQVFELPQYAKFRKNYSKQFVDEVAADCETLSEFMMSLQILVRKWGQLFDEGDIDVSLFSSESQLDLDKYPNCDAFEALLRFIPDVLHKSKQAHTLAYNWWCLAEKIRKKLTGKWKPKTSPQNTLEVPVSSRVSSRSSSQSWTDVTTGGMSPHEQHTSRTSNYHEHCTPRTKDKDWEYPTPSNMSSKLRRKDTFTYVPKAKNKKSWIPRKVQPKKSPQNQPRRKKSSDQKTQTKQRRKDACTSPMVALSDILTDSEHLPHRKEQYDEFSEEIEEDYSYSDEFDEDEKGEENNPVDKSKNGIMHKQKRKQNHDIEKRFEHLTFDVTDNVSNLEKETKELEQMAQYNETKTLSEQVERAIQNIESLQKRLHDIETDKEKLKEALRDSEQNRGEEKKLMENLETLDSKLQNLAGIARVNSYQQQLLASDVDLALQLRGTFTRYNEEVRGKIKLLERLIQEERQEQMRLEREIREMMLHNQDAAAAGEQDMSLQSVTSESTPDMENTPQSPNEASFSHGESNEDQTDEENLYEIDQSINNTDQNVYSKGSKLGLSKGKSLTSSESNYQSSSCWMTSKQGPHLFNPEESTLSPLQEKPSNNNSAASRRGSKTKKRVDSPSPSPKMYDNKRDRVYVDPMVKLPKIAEKSQMVHQT